MKQWIKFISVLALCLMSANAWGRHPQDINQVREKILQERNLEDYPKILGLTQEELMGREINLDEKIQEISREIRTRIEKGIPSLAQKDASSIKKTGGTGKTAVIDFSVSERWAASQHSFEIYNLGQNLNVKTEDMHFYSSGQLVDAMNVVNQGEFTAQNLDRAIKEISQDDEIKQVIFSMHGHGGNWVIRDENCNGYTCVPLISIDPNNPEHEGMVPYAKESEIEFGILRANNWARVIKLDQQSPIYKWAREYEKDKYKIGFCVTLYKPDNFFINNQGQEIAQILKYTYYFSWADSAGEITDMHQIISQEGEAWWVPDMDYLNPYPSIIEKVELDIDKNNKKDIPFAMIINNDTLLAIDMNAGHNYIPINLNASGIDLNQDGFIGKNGEHLDLNDNEVDDEVYIPTIIKIGDGSLLYDLEWQSTLSQIPEHVTLITPLHFCFCGGFSNYPPLKQTIFFASVSIYNMAAPTSYPLSALVQGTKKDSLNFLADVDYNGLSWLELFNFAFTDSNNYFNNEANPPEGFVFRDNPEFPASHGPWPNNEQGYFASQVFLEDETTLVEKEKVIPSSFQLFQNYPNPFNPITTINYEINKGNKVRLIIYDSLGREVIVLVDEEQRPGKYQVIWDATGHAAGIYYCQLIQGGIKQTKKMILMK